MIGAGLAGLIAAAQQAIYRVDNDAVPIYATVFDAAGRLVTDLTSADFEILDNGVPQRITLFSSEIQPLSVVVMLDRSGSVAGSFDRERDAALQFIDRLLADDRARIGSFSERIQLDPAAFTNDKVELRRIVHEELQRGGPTPLWNASSVAITALAGERAKKVVLLFTDGEDNPFIGGRHVTLDEVRSRAIAEDIMLYAIGLAGNCATPASSPSAAPPPQFQQRGPQGPPKPPPIVIRLPRPPGPGGVPPGDGRIGRPRPPDPGVFIPGRSGDDDSRPCSTRPDPGLRTLTAEAGGAYDELEPGDDLSSAFARVADELHRQYLLGFKPSTLDGRVHTLTVRARGNGLNVRARQSYLASPGR
jgi:VWFA-related protein